MLKKVVSLKNLELIFEELTKCKKPPKSKIYNCTKASPVRAVAEFEPMGGVLIAYPGTSSRKQQHIQLPPNGERSFGIPNELIVRMQQADSKTPVQIFILCADESLQEGIIEDLAKTAKQLKIKFDKNLINFILWDTDTFWTRDYGPWWIEYKKSKRFGIAKHLYTSLGGGSVGMVEGAEDVNPREGSGIFRPNDDFASVKVSDYLNAPIRTWNKACWNNQKSLKTIDTHDWFNTGLLNVGGNYMVTGDGIIASSYLVATQNELPIDNEKLVKDPCAKQIEQRMKYILEQFNRFMGLETYHVLTDPSGTYIGHIDCWGKFLAPRKILIAKSQDEKVNKAYDEISKSFEKEGFEVYRVMCQDVYIPQSDGSNATTAAYTNSLILNDHVYVPIAGGVYKKYDDEALAVYKKALPKHTVIGIEGKEEFPWLGTDAMHCRTRAIPRGVIDNWLKSQKQPNKSDYVNKKCK